ncbi:unnamed protein product [Adineta steineri]|uniref:VWFA domain-containing protein n=1 Tax=Adineta steineri TaxID=433720 RepID=A0A815I5T7_9BILA|nr:unnamed protein product [Adineta steineri]
MIIINKQRNKVDITVSSLQTNADIQDFDQIFREILSEITTNIQIQQDQLCFSTNIIENQRDLFSFGCFHYLQIKYGQTDMNTYDTYKELINLYSQIREFTYHNTIERKPIGKVIYQNLKQLKKNDLQKVGSLNLTDWNTIKILSDLLQPYQNVFTQSNVEIIHQDLDYFVKTLDLPNVSSRIASLTYLKNVAHNYGCSKKIENHIRFGFSQTLDNENETEFQLLFEFIDNSKKILKLTAQHVIYGSDYFLDTLYRTTLKTITLFEMIFKQILKHIDLIDDNLIVRIKYENQFFQNLQSEFNQCLQDLKFPQQFWSTFLFLNNYLTNIAPLFRPDRQNKLFNTNNSNNNRNSNENNYLVDNPEEYRKQQQKQKITVAIRNVKEIMKTASQLPIRPHHIIQHIRTILLKMEQFILDKNTSEYDLNILLQEPKQLQDLLDKFKTELNQIELSHVDLPSDQPFESIRDQDIKLIHPNLRVNDYGNDYKNIQDNINNAIKTTEDKIKLNQLINITDSQISSQTWTNAISLLRQSDKIDELKTILSVLNDDLAFQVERILTTSNTANINQTTDIRRIVDDTVKGNILTTYSKFRYEQLKTDFSLISNYNGISQMTDKIIEWKKTIKINLLNIYECIKMISKNLTITQNQLKNFTKNSICVLLPIVLRPEDLLCLLVPQYTNIIEDVCRKYNEFDLSLTTNQSIDPIQLINNVEFLSTIHIGLNQFFYEDNNIPLFDKQKHIKLIGQATIACVQKILDLCADTKIQSSMLVKISTGVHDLFPFQITLSLSLLILTDWSAACLKDFQKKSLKLNGKIIAEQDVIALENKQSELDVTYKDLEKQLDKAKEKVPNAIFVFNTATIQHRALAESELTKCTREVNRLTDELSKQQQKINKNKNELAIASDNYEKQQQIEQDKWMHHLLTYFKQINKYINTCLQLTSQMTTNNSIEDAVNTNMTQSQYSTNLLNISYDIGKKLLLQTFNSNTSLVRNEDLEHLDNTIKKIRQTLDEILNHSMQLSDNDPMKNYLLYYCDLIQISISSLTNSLQSWQIYSKMLITDLMKQYTEENKKVSFCNLGNWVYEHCHTFIRSIQSNTTSIDDIVKLAQNIFQHVMLGITNIETFLSSRQQKSIRSLYDYKRFILALLMTGCRYLQIQRGTMEPMDELIKIIKNNIDYRLPGTELGLLKLLERFELQLQTSTKSLLLQTIHMAFSYSTNPFGLLDDVSQSIKILKRLVLSPGYMMTQMWHTVDALVYFLSKSICSNEHDILFSLYQDFQLIVEFEIIDETKFLDYCMQQSSSELNVRINFEHNIKSLLESMSEKIDRLYTIFIENRPGLKKFCENLSDRWKLTLKEFLRGIIKSRKYQLHNKMEFNHTKIKDYVSLDSTDLLLADIQQMIEAKNSILNNKLNIHEIIYLLTIGGLDNMEIILTDASIENMDFILISKLYHSIIEVYEKGEKVLFERCTSYININNGISNATVNAFNLLDRIRQLEHNIYNNLLISTNLDIQNSINEIRHISNQQYLIGESIKRFEVDWRIACNHFIQTRRARAIASSPFVKKVWNKITSIFGSSSNEQPQLNMLDHIKIFNVTFNDLLNENIYHYMQQSQHDYRLIHIISTQRYLNDLIALHNKYKNLLGLDPLDLKKFSVKTQCFELQATTCLPDIKIYFLKHDKNPINDHIVLLKINNTQLNSWNFAVKTDFVEYIRFEIGENYGTHRIKWSDCKREINVEVPPYFKIKFKRSNKNFYTVNDICDNSSNANIITSDQLEQQMEELKLGLSTLQKCNDEEKQINNLRGTKVLINFNKKLDEIIKNLKNDEILHENNLIDVDDIFNFYKRLPTADIIKQCFRTFNELKDEFSRVNPTRIIQDDSIDNRSDIQIEWSQTMQNAFINSRETLVPAIKQISEYTSGICSLNVHLIVAYAWANVLTVDNNNDNNNSSKDKNFEILNQEYDKICQISGNNPELVKTNNLIRNNANTIYRNTRRVNNNRTEILHMLKTKINLDPAKLNDTFQYSQLGRDAHIWLHKSQDTQTIQCAPLKTSIDFGIALIDIHKHIIQKLIVHNRCKNDIDIEIKPKGQPNSHFYVPTGKITIAAQNITEIDILYIPPNIENENSSNFLIILSENQSTLTELYVCGKVSVVDVEVPTNIIDFGYCPCGGTIIEKYFDIKNSLSCQLNIVAQIQQETQPIPMKSILTIQNEQLNLNPSTTTHFHVSLKPDNIEENIDREICLVINSPKYLKMIKVVGFIRQPKLTISYQGQTVINNQSGQLLITDLYKSEERLISFEYFNDGEVEYALSLSSTLNLSTKTLVLSPGMKETVQINIVMNNTSSRKTATIDINFMNINRSRLTLKIICESQILDLRFPSEIKEEIRIGQSADMEQLWTNITRTMKPIECDISIKNLGRSLTNVKYMQILSKDSTKILSSKFIVTPDKLSLNASTDKTVKCQYYPCDFRDFESIIQFKYGDTFTKIPYKLTFKIPILEISPKAFLDIGVIKNEKTFKSSITLRNIGYNDLKIDAIETSIEQSFITTLTLQSSSQTMALNYPICLYPQNSYDLTLMIDCEKIENHANYSQKIVELGEVTIVSKCDPVIDISGKLSNRKIKLVIIGHFSEYEQLQETGPEKSDWNHLRLLPSDWLRQVCSIDSNNAILNYISFVQITAMAYICTSKLESLPITEDYYKELCYKFRTEQNSRDYENDLSIEEFLDETKKKKVLIAIYECYRLMIDDNQKAFFKWSNLFIDYFDSQLIKSQLFSVINSAENVDEAYTMQTYALLATELYKASTDRTNCQQSLVLIDKMIGQDSVLNPILNLFSQYIHYLTYHKQEDINEVKKILLKLINKSNCELINLLCNDNEQLTINILFTFLSFDIQQDIKQLMLSNCETLIKCLMTIINRENPYYPAMIAIQHRLTHWKKLDLSIKQSIINSLFNNNSKLLNILNNINNQAKFDQILDTTIIIIEYFEQQQSNSTAISYRWIKDIFNKRFRGSISTALRDLRTIPAGQIDSLAFQIEHIYPRVGTYNNNSITDNLTKYNMKDYLDIIHKLISIKSDQWISIKQCLESFWKLLCFMSEDNISTELIFKEGCLFQSQYLKDDLWHKIHGKYTSLTKQLTWKELIDFIDIIGNSNTPAVQLKKEHIKEFINIVQSLQQETTILKVWDSVLKLCSFLLTNNECTELNNKQMHIKTILSTLTFNISTHDLLNQVKPYVSSILQKQIVAYNHLIQSHDLLNDPTNLTKEQQFELLDNLIPSWLVLSNIKCTKSIRVYESLSSILTSFYGLISSNKITYKEQLYTTALSSALCILANCRNNSRDFDIPNDEITSSKAVDQQSILNCIKKNLQNLPISINTSQQTQLSSTTNTITTTSRQSPTPIQPIQSPFTEHQLNRLTENVQKFVSKINSSQDPLITMNISLESSVKDLIDSYVILHKRVDYWYDAFITTNLLFYNQPNFGQISINNKFTNSIAEYGIQLFIRLTVIRRLLEPQFSIHGIQFLFKDLIKIEKCLTSLALQYSRELRSILQKLQIDISRLQNNDIKPPSKTLTLNKSAHLDPFSHSADAPIDHSSFESSSKRITPPPPPTTTTTFTDNDGLDQLISEDEWLKNISTHVIADNKDKQSSNSSFPNHSKSTNVDQILQEMLDKRRARSGAVNMSSSSTPGHLSTASSNWQSKMENLAAQGIKLEMSQKPFVDQIKNTNCLDLYKDAEKITKEKFKSQLRTEELENRLDLSSMTEKDFSKWTYTKLVESQVIAQMIDTILDKFRSEQERLTSNLIEQHELQWCIMIDNSGSMSLHRTFIFGALVIIMEVLRKLESKFAVTRFGGRTNQKILKNLNDHFTHGDGEFVLEALTFDEGTYPATGLARITKKVFPKQTLTNSNSNTIVHKIVIILTDGLTQERDDQTYSSTINEYKINLGFMFIEDKTSNSSTMLLEALKNQSKHSKITSDNISNLPLQMAQLMNIMLQHCLQDAKNNDSSSIKITNKIINIDIPIDIKSAPKLIYKQDPYQNNNESEKIKIKKNITSYTVSQPNSIIPKIMNVKNLLNQYLSRNNSYTNLSIAIGDLRRYYQELTTNNDMQIYTTKAEELWYAEETRLSNIIDDLMSAFSDVVFPYNKYTRRRAALRGSSLYLPGLIKAMTSEWSYKKIFSAKLAGGKRDHALCLVLDISVSMFGNLGESAFETLIIFIGALKKLGLDNYSIVLFGKKVTIIKTHDQIFDSYVIYTLLKQIKFDEEDVSNDAFGLEVAIDLLTSCTTRGERKIFIFTDGYGNCSGLLPMVQQRAEDLGIDLIALGVGIDRTNLQSSYARYIQCAGSYNVPKALRSLCENEPQFKSIDWLKQSEDFTTQTVITQVESIVNDPHHQKAFGEFIHKLNGERDTFMTSIGSPPSNVTVDICFCLDITGSMSRWLSQTKVQMKVIITEIKRQINEKYPSLKLKLNFAIVGYRDITDNPQYETLNFTHDENEVVTFLDKLKAKGGGDCPEDVLGALDKCISLPNWSGSNARFIVLITDAPGHGSDLNDDENDKFKNGTGLTVDKIFKRLLEKDKEIDLMFCCIKPEYTKKMENAFRQQYQGSEGRTLSVIELFDKTKQQQSTNSFHFIFVLDESGSMSGHWTSLVQAYVNFLNTRENDQGGDDIFSVVQFDSGARTVYERRKLAQTARSLPFNGGGTTYRLGLEEASRVLDRDPTNSSIVMIFMSDGADGNSQPLPTLNQIRDKYRTQRPRNFICHTVAFGANVGSGRQLLKDMAANGNGHLFDARDGIQLSQVFTQIAADCNVTNTLVNRFAEILSKDISLKIMVDYL